MAGSYAKYSGLGGSGGGGGSGTVTSVSVVTANGLAGTVANPTTTPAITLSVPTTGLLQSNGTALSAYIGGSLVESTSAVLTIGNGANAVIGTGTTIQVKQATTSQSGYLSSADWTTFNGKQATGNYATSGTGDVSWSAPSGAGPVTTSLVATANTTLTSLANLATVGTIATGTWAGTTVAINHGGTGVASVTTSPAASSWAGWDANKNFSANAMFGGFTTTVTSATPVTLTVASTQFQAFTGTTAQTVTLPTTGVAAGMSWTIYNLGTATLTLEASGGATIQAMSANTFLIATANAATPTTVAGWYWQYDTVDSTLLPISLGGTGASSLATGAISSNGTVLSSGTLSIANGGTAKTSVTIAPTASSWAGWDANLNMSARAFIPAFTTTATAAGTTALTIASNEIQVFTGATTQTVTLPTTSMVAGGQYTIINLSTGNVTVQSSGANAIQVMTKNTSAIFTALVATPTTAANWTATYTSLAGAFVTPTVQTFTSGSAATYTTPTSPRSPLYLKVTMVGGGGAGGGYASATPATGGSGGNTIFGTSLLTAGGGVGGSGGGAGGIGGTNTISGGTTLINIAGAGGGPAPAVATASGGSGASSPLGGGGAGGFSNAVGSAAPSNSGAGGGGGSTTNANSCSGGGAGGYLQVFLTGTLNSTYTYTVGAAGTATSGGGGGGAGLIVVEEYYQ